MSSAAIGYTLYFGSMAAEKLEIKAMLAKEMLIAWLQLVQRLSYLVRILYYHAPLGSQKEMWILYQILP